jgi:hypothetical protein
MVWRGGSTEVLDALTFDIAAGFGDGLGAIGRAENQGYVTAAA